MYMVVRTYEHADPRFGNEGFRRVHDEVIPKIRAMPGFISFYSAYDRDRGTVTSVTVYETRESAEEATRLAEEWGRQNLAIMGTMHPTAWVGEVLVHASAY